MRVSGLKPSKNVVSLQYKKPEPARTFAKPDRKKKIDDQVSNYSEKADKGKDAPNYSQLGGRLFENRMQRSTSNEAYVRGDFNSSSYNKKYAGSGTNSARKVDKGADDMLGRRHAPSVREFEAEKKKAYTSNQTVRKSTPTANDALRNMGITRKKK